MNKKIRGITLISLVITIIVLIILSSIAIYLSLGNNGIFTRAREAKEASNKQTATELINLKITNCQMNKYAEKQEIPTLQELADVLYEDNEIQYVALETKVGNKEKVTVGDKTSIFTKLNEYPYEFEINKSLQLASIDGVRLLTVLSKDDDTIVSMTKAELKNFINTSVKAYNYSETEQVIGTWIDGKPIYQRTYNVGSMPNNSTKKVAHNISDLDLVINMFGAIYRRNGEWDTLPRVGGPNNQYYIWCSLEGNDIFINTSSDQSMRTGYVTIQYTKKEN